MYSVCVIQASIPLCFGFLLLSGRTSLSLLRSLLLSHYNYALLPIVESDCVTGSGWIGLHRSRVMWNMAPESNDHVRLSCVLYRTSSVEESSKERTSLCRDSATLTWMPIGKRFDLGCPWVWLSLQPFSFLFMDHQSEMLWPTFLQCVQKLLDQPVLDFKSCK